MKASIAGFMAAFFCTAGAAALAQASDGMHQNFLTICRDTDAAPSAVAAAAQRAGYVPMSAADIKSIQRDAPGAVAFERKRGKEEIGVVARVMQTKGKVYDTCVMMGQGVPVSEVRQVRAWLGEPAGKALGQEIFIYRKTPQGPVPLSKDKARNAGGAQAEVREVSAGSLLTLRTLMFMRERPS